MARHFFYVPIEVGSPAIGTAVSQLSLPDLEKARDLAYDKFTDSEISGASTEAQQYLVEYKRYQGLIEAAISR